MRTHAPSFGVAIKTVETDVTQAPERARFIALLLVVAVAAHPRDTDAYVDALAPIARAWRRWYETNEQADEGNSALERQFDWMFRHVRLNSPQGDNWRQLHQHQANFQQEQELAMAGKNNEDPAPLIESQLTDSETGKAYAWGTIVRNLAFDSSGTYCPTQHRNRPLELAGWMSANEQTRVRIVESAKRFLLQVEPKNFDVLHRYWRYPYEEAAYKALCLIFDLQEHKFIEQLPPAIWKKWATALVMVDESSGLHESVRHRLFLHLAYQQAPDAVTGAFRLWLAAEIQKDGHPDSLDWLEPILLERLAPDPELEALVNSGKWSFLQKSLWREGDNFGNVLLDFLKRPNTPASTMMAFARPLVREGVTDAIDFTKKVAGSFHRARTEKAKQRATAAGVVLCEELPDGGFETVWPLIQKSPALGESLVEWLAPQSDFHDDPKTPRWMEHQLADLYVWMRSHYPKKQDLDILDSHYNETREFIQRMRDNLVNRIMRSFSQSGHEQLRRLCETFPHDGDLRAQLQHFENERRRRDWKPMPISEILSLSREERLLHEPTVGVITALPHEFAAMQALLDDSQERFFSGAGASRRFMIGTIPSADSKVHVIALALLPDAGNNMASSVGTNMLGRFPHIQHLLMCGIAGAAPYPQKPDDHVRLGDIVCSGRQGVVQYDFVKQGGADNPEDKRLNFAPRPPSSTFLEAARFLEAKPKARAVAPGRWIRRAAEKTEVRKPTSRFDVLYQDDV